MTTTVEPPIAAGPAEPAEPSALAPPKAPRIGYMPALDGMRGVYVLLGPLAYHFAPYWISGGILGIDLFFVLSSFLIITIALNEFDKTGRIDIAAYASRRIRRLVPALCVTVVVLAFFTAFIIEESKIDLWTGGITSALSYVANWREIFAGTDYFAEFQFSNPNPMRHVWSFAIEEQFYLFAPFFVIACLKWLSKRWLFILSSVGAVASAWWMAVVHDPANPDTISRAYYGTDTRAFALLVGIAMAVVCWQYGPPRTRFGQRLTQILGLAATAVFTWLMFVIDERTSWMFEKGGFFLVAILSAFMTRAVTQPTGLMHPLFTLRPLKWVGKLGYGLYMYHWLVFIVVDRNKQERGLNGARDLILGFGITIVVAALSWKVIEQPFLKGRWKGWRLTAGIAASFAAVFGLLLYAHTVRLDGSSTAVASELPACEVPDGSDPVRVLVVGDSVMVQMAAALQQWCADNPGQIALYSNAHLGCGTTRFGQKTYELPTGAIATGSHGGDGDGNEVCGTWAEPWPADRIGAPSPVSWVSSLGAFQPDVVLTYPSPWDSIDRQVDSLGPDFLRPGDAAYDAYIESEYTEAFDLLTSTGARVIVLKSPHLAQNPTPYNNPERIDRVNEIVLPIADAAGATVVDYPAEFLGPNGGEDSTDLRDDGVHLTDRGQELVAEWLVPQLIAAASPG